MTMATTTTTTTTLPMKSSLISYVLVWWTIIGVAALPSVELEPDSLEEALSTKNSFIKFYAPWCGHCKALAPDWDTLSTSYHSSPSVLIGSVDCTAEANEELCHSYGVQGYPTLKYFVDGDTQGQDYNGPRSLPDLEEFVAETLDRKCDVANYKNGDSNCSSKEKDYVVKMKAKSAVEREAQINRLDKMKNGSMKSELRVWISKRLHILRSIQKMESDDGDEEDEL